MLWLMPLSLLSLWNTMLFLRLIDSNWGKDQREGKWIDMCLTRVYKTMSSIRCCLQLRTLFCDSYFPWLLTHTYKRWGLIRRKKKVKPLFSTNLSIWTKVKRCEFVRRIVDLERLRNWSSHRVPNFPLTFYVLPLCSLPLFPSNTRKKGTWDQRALKRF